MAKGVKATPADKNGGAARGFLDFEPVSSEESSELFTPPFTMDSKRRRKSRKTELASSLVEEDHASLNGDIHAEKRRDALRSLLFNHSNSSVYQSDDEANWLGGNLQKQKV